MRLFWYSLLFISFCFSSCDQSQTASFSLENFESIPLDHAKNFQLFKKDDLFLIKILKPWNESQTSFTYLLYPKDNKAPETNNEVSLIPYPLTSIVCTSTTHLAFLERLQALDLLVGMSGTNYVYSPSARSRIENKKLIEVGNESDLNYEKIIRLAPDAVWTYSIGPTKVNKKLKDLSQRPVVFAEFLDHSMLGRAEWIKLVGLLIGKFEEAQVIFSQIEKEYLAIQELPKPNNRPTVLTGMGFEGIWYIPQGDSYVAHSIEDAGGDYIWADQPGQGSLSFDFEKVYAKGKDAKIWINVGQVNSLSDLEKADSRYSLFKAVDLKSVYNSNARVSAKGGWDIYESGIVYPEIILKDLTKIFYPSLLPDHKFVYYKALQ